MLKEIYNDFRDNAIYLLTFYLLFSTFFIRDPLINLLNISTCILIMSKWFSNINVCSMGILECKLRKVSREKSYVYQVLDNIVDINKRPEKYLFYILYQILLIINFRKFRKSNFNLLNIEHYKEYINRGFVVGMKFKSK